MPLRSHAALAVLAAASLAASTAHAAGDRLLETGSSLLYPLFNVWVPAYTQQHSGTQITTQSTGSGTGISQAVSGLAQVGASDAYLSNTLAKQHPDMLNIPLAISSQMINVNLPGLDGQHLKLSGPVLAGIYQGKIHTWNDPAIAKLNPGVNLPSNPIIPIHRTDGSGDTFIFTQYLSDTDPAWQKSLAYGTTISWPSVPGALGAEGNQGMVNTLKQTPYGIAYIGISFAKPVEADKLGTAMLQNKSGKFVLPDDRTVQAAASADAAHTPANERISLIDAAGENAYPIINYEYAIVDQKQPDAQTAQTLKNFLSWSVAPNGGNAPTYLDQVGFVALPASVRNLSMSQIDKIAG